MRVQVMHSIGFAMRSAYAVLLLLAWAVGAQAKLELTYHASYVVPNKFSDDATAQDGVLVQTVTDAHPYWSDFNGKKAVFEVAGGAAEQSAYDKYSNLVFAAGEGGFVHVLALGSDGNLTPKQAFDFGSTLTDIETCRSGDTTYVILGAEGPDGKKGRGEVHVLKVGSDKTVSNMTSLNPIQVGYLPDMVKPSPDCSMVVVANEGEGVDTDTGFMNPEGSVSVITFNADMTTVATNKEVMLTSFNADASTHHAAGVHYAIRPSLCQEKGIDVTECTLSKDLEPEYVAFTSDMKTAIVCLQDNNAIVTVDVSNPADPVLGKLIPLGLKQWGGAGLMLDASDKDDAINMQQWEVYSMYQPDSMKVFSHGGDDYILFANEGDAKEYKWFTEDDKRCTDLKAQMAADAVNTMTMDGMGDTKLLGRYKVTMQAGATENNPSLYEKIVGYGGRSFSIYKINKAGGAVDSLTQVYERLLISGDTIETYHKDMFPTIFNAEAPGDLSKSMADEFDGRSSSKGIETESVEAGTLVSGKKVIFIGNERTSTLMMYDVTAGPENPKFETLSLRGDASMPVKDMFTMEGITTAAGREKLMNLDPEDMHFIPAADNPVGIDLLLVVGALVGSLNVYKVVDTEYRPTAAGNDVDSAAAALPISMAMPFVLALGAMMLTNAQRRLL